MAKVDGNQPGVKAAPPGAPAGSPAPADAPAPRPATDALTVTPGSAPPSEAARQAATVAAAKAALAGKSGEGAGSAGDPAPVGSFAPKSLWQKAKEGATNLVGGLAKIMAGDHPIAAIGRGALRVVPVAGIISLAHDSADAAKTLTDPKLTVAERFMVGTKALAGAAAVGGAGLLLVTGAGAFLPWTLGAGAVALIADVAVSRIRRGSWS
ncbi:MAG: hypothetical protein FJZ01_10090 [Candidatus Sericytochromatia bacterium]|nr:hypothetical protein [Candidatus Tanganyikabacteria bacterium]